MCLLLNTRKVRHILLECNEHVVVFNVTGISVYLHHYSRIVNIMKVIINELLAEVNRFNLSTVRLINRKENIDSRYTNMKSWTLI